MAIKPRNRKWFVLLATATITIIFVISINNDDTYQPIIHLTKKPFNGTNWRKFSDVNYQKKLSVLGRILFLGEEPPKPHNPNKTYKILLWKYGSTIEKRHMRGPNNEIIDPFAHCSVKNCKITYKDEDVESADLIIFHLHRMKTSDTLPKRSSYDQIWAFLTDESPFHTFLSSNKVSNYNGVFNWSMTYRMDSDIPVPYGRTVLRENSEGLDPEPWRNKRRNVLVSILGSNCATKSHRWKYVKELQKHITVDIYGKCGPLQACPGHFRQDCKDIDQYLFYLSFENSNCDQYITEKLWWNAYAKNSIPVVMGAFKEDYHQLLPPNSYLNVEEFAKPKDLADYILYLNKTEKFRELYNWRYNYEILNEHGYFQTKSYHYCRACEALNYNTQEPKVYKNMDDFWNLSRDCYSAWDAD